MDGEEVSAELTEQLCQDKDSQESWAAYHTVRAVMRKRVTSIIRLLILLRKWLI